MEARGPTRHCMVLSHFCCTTVGTPGSPPKIGHERLPVCEHPTNTGCRGYGGLAEQVGILRSIDVGGQPPRHGGDLGLHLIVLGCVPGSRLLEMQPLKLGRMMRDPGWEQHLQSGPVPLFLVMVQPEWPAGCEVEMLTPITLGASSLPRGESPASNCASFIG